MAYNFPNNPSNGDTVTVNSITYTYNSTSGAWKTTASAGGGGGASVTVSETAPASPTEGDLWFDPSVLKTFVYYSDGTANQWVQSNPTGGGSTSSGGASVTVSETAPTSPSAGDLWWSSSEAVMYIYYTDTDSSQWVSTSTPGADGSAQSYTNFAGFPSTGNTLGDLAVAQDTKALYMWDGAEWDRVALGNDESPVITTEPPTTTQQLNSDGTTSTVTMVAQDPEGFDITYGIAYKTANNARPSQLSVDTTINQSTGVYTFTPSTTESNAGTFTARLSASDGARITTRFVDFSLQFAPIIDYLIVAGGGAGGNWVGGGGGGGGVLTGTSWEGAFGTQYDITVGAGGARGGSDSSCGGAVGGSGGNSSFASFTAIGGGGGGSYNGINATNGGSGGGARHNSYGGTDSTAGSGTTGQGYAGRGRTTGGNGGGGGGGAGSIAGTNGHGGDGIQSSITGTATYYGGGGGGYNAEGWATGDTGGLGGGGNGAGATTGDPVATAGTDGLGGGGGGGSGCPGNPVGLHPSGARDGGSGVVILRFPSSITPSATTGSPSIATDGTDSVYTWTQDGSITF